MKKFVIIVTSFTAGLVFGHLLYSPETMVFLSWVTLAINIIVLVSSIIFIRED